MNLFEYFDRLCEYENLIPVMTKEEQESLAYGTFNPSRERLQELLAENEKRGAIIRQLFAKYSRE